MLNLQIDRSFFLTRIIKKVSKLFKVVLKLEKYKITTLLVIKNYLHIFTCMILTKLLRFCPLFDKISQLLIFVL